MLLILILFCVGFRNWAILWVKMKMTQVRNSYWMYNICRVCLCARQKRFSLTVHAMHALFRLYFFSPKRKMSSPLSDGHSTYKPYDNIGHRQLKYTTSETIRFVVRVRQLFIYKFGCLCFKDKHTKWKIESLHKKALKYCCSSVRQS